VVTIGDLFTPERLVAAQRAVAAADLDAILLTPGADLRYLTGYRAHPLERLTCLVVPAEGEVTLIVPKLERPAAEASPAPGTGLRIVDHADGTDPFPLVVQALGKPARIGIGNRMWAEHSLAIRAVLPDAEQHLAGDVMRELRMRKSGVEIEALASAASAIDAVHARMGDWLSAGRTEEEVGADIADAIRLSGHASVDFVIVASGPNAASPHHETSDRVIMSGDPVVVDIGGTMPSGYCSDSTRTYVVGSPPPDFVSYYQVLYTAQQASVAAVRPGVTCESVDAAARDIITAAGFGDAFLHRTGHGIGMDGHEEPYIVAGNTLPLEPGMAFSIEPGIYLAGRHGARIEDIVVCTDEGVRRLNILSTELVVL
jgi:Xaa-Pro aminopeptidase